MWVSASLCVHGEYEYGHWIDFTALQGDVY